MSFLSFVLRIIVMFSLKKNFISNCYYNKSRYKYLFSPKPSSYLSRNYQITEELIRNQSVFTIQNKSNVPKTKTILYLHGGSYITSFSIYHWKFINQLLKNNDTVRVIAPDYPLSPEFSCLDNMQFLDELILKYDNYFQERFILMGDSAGGGLALALAQRLKQQNKKVPDELILLSPFLDYTLSNPMIESIQKDDIFLNASVLRSVRQGYAGNLDFTNPFLSPINGDLNDIGNISIFIGTHDILYADALDLKEKCFQKNIPLQFFEYPKMIHVWMIFTLIPESKKVVKQILNIID
jgi:acetyl esterase/lipase